MYLRGVLDSVHFHRMRKVTTQSLHAPKNLADKKSKNSQSFLIIVN
jgi:hypothetical protein